MPLHILHSNRTEKLLEDLAQRAARPLPKAGPLDGETILIDNPSLGKWINLQLALKNSVAANIRYLQPADLFWELSRALVSGEIPEQTPLNKEEMTWRILGLLERDEVLALPPMGPVRNYLADGVNAKSLSDLKRFQLASSVADLFDQYLVYRPRWITGCWDDGNTISDPETAAFPRSWLEAESWQRVLWGKLLDHAGTPAEFAHRACVEKHLFQALSGGIDSDRLRFHRLFVFGITSMPEGQLDTLMLLARHIDVHLYLLNPCEFEWFGIKSAKKIAQMAGWKVMQNRRTARDGDGSSRASASEDPGLAYLEIGNPLLAAQADQVREFLRMVFNKFDTFHEHASIEDEMQFQAPDSHTLLGSIQREILAFEYRGDHAELSTESGQERSMPAAELDPDKVPSIHIHNCHSPLREVEVLHDQLLDMFSRDTRLRPRDVVVMMPRVAPYAPYIHSVFQGAPKEQRMDYHLNDRSLLEESPLLNSFESLLKLPDSRMPLSEVLGMFEVPAVHSRFGLDRDGFETLRAWLIESGVHWGLDAQHRQELGLPAYSDFSWEFGMDRLLAGYAMSARVSGVEAGRLAEPLEMRPAGGAAPFNIVPLDEVEGSNAGILDSFLRYWRALNKYRNALQTPKTPGQWKIVLSDLLDAFYQPAENEWRALNALRQGVEALDTASRRGWYENKLSLAVIRAVIKPVLQQAANWRHPWNEGVKFCSLMPMRGVPFKVVYLLGINMDDYPRRLDSSSFDLMRNSYRPGDRSARIDDRWLFLEALLSARSCFHASYTGQDLHRNEKREPSVVLSELIDYIRNGYETGGLYDKTELKPGTHLYTRHPLQPFSPAYFGKAAGKGVKDRVFSFNQQAYKVAAGQAQTRAGDGNRAPDNQRWIANGPPEPGVAELDLDDFCAFFTRPWDWFFKKQGVWFGRHEDEVDDDDVFQLQPGLGPWKLVDKLLETTAQPGFVAPSDTQGQSRLKRQLINELVAGQRAVGQWPMGSAAAREESKLMELNSDFLFALAGRHASRLEIEVDIKLDSSSAAEGPATLRIRGALDCYDKEFLARAAGKASEKQLLDFYIRLAVGCHDPAFRKRVHSARKIFKDTRNPGNPQNYKNNEADLPLRLEADVLGNEAGYRNILQTLCGLYVAYRQCGLPFHPGLGSATFSLEGGELAEALENKWFGSGGPNNYDQAIKDDLRQRAYFGSPDALTSSAFFTTSKMIWDAFDCWFAARSAGDD